jgi:hypothetical protein
VYRAELVAVCASPRQRPRPPVGGGGNNGSGGGGSQERKVGREKVQKEESVERRNEGKK